MDGFETFNVKVRDIDVLVRRKGDGNPLLYLHGAFGYEGWPRFLDLLSENFTVYSPVHPGFLESDGIDEIRDLYDLVLFHIDLIEALNLDSPYLVGQFFGAMAAGEVASVCPHNVGKLVLANPAGIWLDEDPGLDYFVVPDSELRDHLVSNPESKNSKNILPETKDETEQSSRSINKVRALSTVAKFLWPVPDKGLIKRVSRVRCPTLVITCEKDEIVPVSHGEIISSVVFGSAHETIPGAGHLGFLEKPEELASLVVEFLNE